MRYRHAGWLGGLLMLVGAGAAGCGGGDLTTPPTGGGALAITTTTTGTEMDPDGYTVQVDGQDAGAIGTAATIQRSDLTAGSHTVQLAGLAANCTVTGENPRTVSVTAGQTSSLSFEVTCGAVSGGLQVSASTTGPSPDPDGYSITVDGTDRGTVGASAAVNLTGVTAGPHEIGLSGVAGNCTVSGDNPQSVTVPAGASATVSFALTCAAASADAGSLRITTATTGADADANGYRVTVDAGSPQPIGVNASTTIANVPAGSHSVRLSGLAANCTAQGTNPRSVNLAAGATAEVSFAVACSATSGTVEIHTTTTGSNPDPDGYAVSVDGAASRAIGVNATLPIAGVAAGTHQVALSGMAANCSVQGSNPQPVTVAVGASATVAFTITCPASSGSSWAPMASGTTKSLGVVSGSSATNVFAGGAGAVCDTAFCGEMSILHYDGTSWSTQFTHRGGIVGLWAAPTGEAFGLAEGSTFSAQLLHYDGHGWSIMAAQAPLLNGTLFGLWGFSATDVFVTGYHYDGETRAYVAHYDGTQWSRMDVPGGDFITLQDVWGSSPTDLYAVGNYDPYDSAPVQNAVIFHYDGHAWAEVLRVPGTALAKIWGSSASDVYATGSSGSNGAVWHYDGHTWSAMSPPPAPILDAIWASSSRDIYVLARQQGSFKPSGNIWHFDGTTWTEIRTTASGLMDIWGSSASDIFAVGTNGTILHGP